MKYKRITDEKFVKAVETCNMACVYGEPCIECVYFKLDNCPETVQSKLKKAIPRLAEIEDKIQQGTLIELPCKVGDTVYAVKKKALSGHWDEHRYIVDDWDEWKVCELSFSLTLWECGGILGKDYYLTREEAEKRLLELQGEK